LLRQTSEKVDSRARGSRARFRRKPGSPSWIRASVDTSSVMVSFGGTGTDSLGTAPVESDDRRAAMVKRWVAGGEEVGSSADQHPRAQKKENRRAESPAGTAALNVATAPVKKLQASLRRGYNREHDEYKILWPPLSRSLGSLHFGPENAGDRCGFSFSIVCSVLPLRVKDLPLTLPLDGFMPAADPTGGR
jgi:hypothetical protein